MRWAFVTVFVAAACRQEPLSLRAPVDAGPDFAPTVTVVDTADCAARSPATCKGVATAYDSDRNFSETPELAMCSRYITFDGCGRLELAFDGAGCLASLTAKADPTDHLVNLRACLVEGYRTERWPCLAGQTVVFTESCFIF